MTLEYLIRPNDADGFNLQKVDFEQALRPTTFSYSIVEGWGEHRIEVNKVEIAFSYEDVGLQIIFDGQIEQDVANQIIHEIKGNLEIVTNQSGRVIQL